MVGPPSFSAHHRRAVACGAAQPPFWPVVGARRRLACRCAAGVRAEPSYLPRAAQAHSAGDAAAGPSRSRCSSAPNEINYDYTNERVSAIGNVQIYYGASTLEADQVIYDQKTKRLHAEGNVRLTEADGKITYGEIIDLSDDFRDGFVDSLRLDDARPDPHRGRARRSHRRQLHRVPERRLHRLRGVQGRSAQAAAVAGQGRAHHPRSGREDDLFRGRALEFFGVPLAYFPYFSTPDPTVKRKTGFLMPIVLVRVRSTASRSTIPYYLGAGAGLRLHLHAEDHHQAGPAAAGRMAPAAGERLLHVRASGIFQLDKDEFLARTARRRRAIATGAAASRPPASSA